MQNSEPFHSDYERFIYKSRYARWLETEQRRENLNETVSRYINFMEGHLSEKHGYELAPEVRDELFTAIHNLEVVPSMRALMTAGPALARDNTCGFNCSYLVVDDPKAFDEAMYILLCGTGVGFSVERQYIQKLPEVPDTLYESDTKIVVADSKAGWAKAYRQLLALLWSGEIPKWDMSKVRPAGARLKVFGGRASGPGPLVDLFEFSIATFKKAVGRKLTSIECHDLMCKIGFVVVSGGVRRSAMLSLSNLTDQRMAKAKSGSWWEQNGQRALANNSVAYTEKPDVGAFMAEWTALYESKSGERGIFNRAAAEKQVLKNGRREGGHDWGCNPCCVSGETEILTDKGYVAIADAIDQNVNIWNGESWEKVVPYEAGEGELVRVTLSDGSFLDCTWNHRWVVKGQGFVETEKLSIGDRLEKFEMPVVETETWDGDLRIPYSQGFYSGDGNKGLGTSYLYAPKYDCQARLIGSFKQDSAQNRLRWVHGPMLDKAYVPIEMPINYKLQWLAGLLDSDGTVTRDKNGSGFQIVSADHAFLDRLRLFLTTLGVRAKVASAHSEGFRPMPDGNGGSKEYFYKETKRILIGNHDAWKLMSLGLDLSRLDHNGNPPQRDARQFVRVVSIEELDRYEMTFCFTEPKTSRGTFNGIVTGNSEILLRPYQFCNLSEVVVRSDDTEETLAKKVRAATILGTIQSTLTNFPYLRKIWQRNTEEECLLGVSLTGIMDSALMNGKTEGLPELLERLKQVAIDTNAEFADAIGINRSTAICAVKPSGTVSQLVNAASGIHARHSPFYIRSVRGANTDPITQFMKEAGIPNEPDVTNPERTTVFFFPIESPKDSITRNDMTAIEQLELWKVYQDHWCEQKPSVTISVREHEWPAVGGWVYDNFDCISGISFLPHSEHSYKQAPYEECSEEKYLEMKAKMPSSIDWTALQLFEFEDATTGSSTLACGAGGCEDVDVAA